MCLYPSRLQTQSVECEQLKPGVYWSRSSSDSQWNLISSKQEHARCQVIADTATGASVIEPSAGWTVRHHARHVPYTGGQQERGFLKTREEKKKKIKTSPVYRGIMVYMDNTCLQRHNDLHGQYVSTET